MESQSADTTPSIEFSKILSYEKLKQLYPDPRTNNGLTFLEYYTSFLSIHSDQFVNLNNAIQFFDPNMMLEHVEDGQIKEIVKELNNKSTFEYKKVRCGSELISTIAISTKMPNTTAIQELTYRNGLLAQYSSLQTYDSGDGAITNSQHIANMHEITSIIEYTIDNKSTKFVHSIDMKNRNFRIYQLLRNEESQMYIPIEPYGPSYAFSKNRVYKVAPLLDFKGIRDKRMNKLIRERYSPGLVPIWALMSSVLTNIN